MVGINPLVRLGELTFRADDDTLVREVHALLDPAATLRLNGGELDVQGYLLIEDGDSPAEVRPMTTGSQILFSQE